MWVEYFSRVKVNYKYDVKLVIYLINIYVTTYVCVGLESTAPRKMHTSDIGWFQSHCFHSIRFTTINWERFDTLQII